MLRGDQQGAEGGLMNKSKLLKALLIALGVAIIAMGVHGWVLLVGELLK